MKTTELNREEQLIAEADELVREKQWNHRVFALSVIFTKAKIEGDEIKAALSFQLMEKEIDKIRADPMLDAEQDERKITKTTIGYASTDNNNINKSRQQKGGLQKQRQYHHTQTGEYIEALLIEERKGRHEGQVREEGITQKNEPKNRLTKQPKFMERLQLALFLTDLLTRIEKEEEKEGGNIARN